MRDTITCLILLVAFVNVLGVPIGTCTGEGSAASTNVFLPDSNNCSVYYSCTNGDILRIICPSELHFSAASQTCEHPSSAGCRTSMSQTDSPTRDSTSGVPIEETTGEITTECVITEDGIGISTEYISESPTDSLTLEGVTLPTNGEVFYISTDITIQISTTDSPASTEFTSDIQSESPEFSITAPSNRIPVDGSVNLPAVPSSQDSNTVSAGLIFDQPVNNLPVVSSDPLPNTLAPGDAIQSTDVLGSESPNSVLTEGYSNPPAVLSILDSNTVTPGFVSDQPGNNLPVVSSDPLPNTVAPGDTIQYTDVSGSESPNSVLTEGYSNPPAVLSTLDSNTVSAGLTSGQPGNNLPAASIPSLPNPVATGTPEVSTAVSGLDSVNDVSVDNVENLAAVPSSPGSKTQSAVLPSGEPVSTLPDTGSAVLKNAAVSGNVVQNSVGSGLISANDVSADNAANLAAVPSSPGSNTQSAVLPSGEPVSTLPDTGSAVLPNAAVSGNVVQKSVGSGLVSPNDVSADNAANLAAVPSSPNSDTHSAVLPSGQSGNTLPDAGSVVLPNSAVSGNVVQNSVGSGLVSANDVSAGNAANLAAVPSSPGSNTQSAVLPSGEPVSTLPDTGSAVLPNAAVSGNVVQKSVGSGLVSANDVSADNAANLAAVPSSPNSDTHSAVLPSGQSGITLPDAGSVVLPNSAVSGNVVQNSVGSGLDSANDVSADNAANLAAVPSSPGSNTQSAVLPSGELVSTLPDTGSAVLPNAAVSGNVVQKSVGSGLVSANDVSADNAANLAAVPSSPNSDTHSAVLPSGQSGNTLPDAGSVVLPNSAVSGNVVQNSVGSGLDSANDVSADNAANLAAVPSSPGSNTQSAVLPSGQSGNTLLDAGSAVLPNAAVSGNVVQNSVGSGLVSVNDVSADNAANLAAVPSSPDSDTQSAVLPSGQSGNTLPNAGSALLPNTAASGNIVQNAAVSGLASSNSVSTDGSANLPAIQSSPDSNTQSALWPSGWSVNYFPNGGLAIPWNPVSLNIPQLAGGPLPTFANIAPIDVPSKPPAVAVPASHPQSFNAHAESRVTSEISAIQSKKVTSPLIAQSAGHYPAALPPLSVPTNFHARPSVEYAAGQASISENVPYKSPYYFKTLATELPSKFLAKPTSKLTIEDGVKSALNKKIKSDLKHFSENLTSVSNKPVDSRDVITEIHNSESHKKLVKEFISNVTTIFNQIPKKSHYLQRNLPNFSTEDYKKFIKEFINNVTIAINKNPYKYQNLSLVQHHYSPDIYKRLVGEFIRNITAVHNSFSANSRKVSIDSLRRAKEKLIDDLNIDDSSDSEESEESSRPPVATTPRLSRPTTVHPRFEWIAHKSQRKQDKQSKRRKHSDSDSSKRSSKDSDED